MPIFENAPRLKKIEFGNENISVVVYGGAIHINDKQFKRKRTLRIVIKSADKIGGPGVLFKLLKLTVQIQDKAFEDLIRNSSVQKWFLQAAKNYIEKADWF